MKGTIAESKKNTTIAILPKSCDIGSYSHEIETPFFKLLPVERTCRQTCGRI